MSGNLYEINLHLKECLTAAFQLADACNEQGIADFLAGRIDMHGKWIWQLGATIGANATAINRIEV
jgi:DNA-binding ferritin-like protein